MNQTAKKMLIQYTEELSKAQHHVARAIAFEEIGIYELFEREIHQSKDHFNEALFYLHEAGKLI